MMGDTMADKKIGKLILGGFRLVDGDGNTIAEGATPEYPRTEVPVEIRSVE
jgi:hypothetical protein